MAERYTDKQILDMANQAERLSREYLAGALGESSLFREMLSLNNAATLKGVAMGLRIAVRGGSTRVHLFGRADIELDPNQIDIDRDAIQAQMWRDFHSVHPEARARGALENRDPFSQGSQHEHMLHE